MVKEILSIKKLEYNIALTKMEKISKAIKNRTLKIYSEHEVKKKYGFK